MKKLLLGLGSITAVVAPVAAVVSCGDDAKTPQNTVDTNPSTAGTVVADTTKVTTLKNDFIASGLVSGIVAGEITAVRSGNAFNYDDNGTAVKADASITFEITADTKTLTINGDSGHLLTAAPVTLTILAVADLEDDGSVDDPVGTLKYIFTDATGTKTVTTFTTATAANRATKKAIEGMFTTTGYITPEPATTVTQVETLTIGDGTHGGFAPVIAAGKVYVGASISGAFPAHLAPAQVESVVNTIKTMTGIATVTEIDVILEKHGASARTAHAAPNVELKVFKITVTAGKAADLEAVKTAAATTAIESLSMTQLQAMPIVMSHPGGHSLTGGHSTSGTGTQAPAAQQPAAAAVTSVTVDLTADIKADALADQIVTAIGAEKAVTTAIVNLDSKALTITFTAGATKADIKTAITAAVTASKAFTNCFDAA